MTNLLFHGIPCLIDLPKLTYRRRNYLPNWRVPSGSFTCWSGFLLASKPGPHGISIFLPKITKFSVSLARNPRPVEHFSSSLRELDIFHVFRQISVNRPESSRNTSGGRIQGTLLFSCISWNLALFSVICGYWVIWTRVGNTWPVGKPVAQNRLMSSCQELATLSLPC